MKKQTYFIFTLCPFVVNVSRLIIFRRERKKIVQWAIEAEKKEI